MMSIITQVAGASKSTPPSTGTVTGTNPTGSVTSAANAKPGMIGDTSWHVVVLWFLGAIALLALADPAPQIATGIVVILILGALLNNWPIYRTYLGLPGNAGSAASATKG